MVELNTIYNEDCLVGMADIPENSVDLTVTSPPYDDLRKYNGYSWEPDKVIASLYKITKLGGVVVWVVGDQTVKGSETGSSFRQALMFMEVGFNLHDTMIYAKNNPIPQNHNRYEQSFEYMFVLTKGKPKTFNPLKEPTKNAGKKFDWGGRKTLMDESQARRHRDSEVYEVPKEKTRRNIFYYSVGGGKTGHPAVFPVSLAEDRIRSWSNEGDVVLDPFMGSGTTAVAAINTGRNYIGYELDADYHELATKRVAEHIANKTDEDVVTP